MQPVIAASWQNRQRTARNTQRNLCLQFAQTNIIVNMSGKAAFKPHVKSPAAGSTPRSPGSTSHRSPRARSPRGKDLVDESTQDAPVVDQTSPDRKLKPGLDYRLDRHSGSCFLHFMLIVSS